MATERPALVTEDTVAGPRDGITMEKIEQEIKNRDLKSGAKYKLPKKKKNITIESIDFTKKKGKKQLRLSDYQEVIIQYCKFGKKSTKGQGLEITGSKTKKVTVQYCIFEDFTSKVKNGGEPLRLGNSEFSGCILECVVKNNIFRNCTQKDPEMISIKSCNNIIEDNFFIDNESMVTVRHGGLTKIQHNYFKRKNGVRIHGYNNYVGYNCFEDNSDTDDLSPITVRWGSHDKDPNWKNFKNPSGKKGRSHALYAQAKNTVIEGNEFKNCKNTIITLKKKAKKVKIDKPPEDTKSDNNREVKKFTFETRD